MRRTPHLDPAAALAKLGTYPYQVLTWVDDTGYPISVAVVASFDSASAAASFLQPAGLAVPLDREVSLTGSHIRPQPGYGYDERRHVTAWGRISDEGGRLSLHVSAAWGWDEQEVSFFEYSERSIGQSRRYFDALSLERGTPVRPRLARGWLALRATRLPFLTATLVPVLIGIAIAATHGYFNPLTALLTIVGGSLIQIGLNVANDVFDTTQGADEVNVTPTKYSGGSRVIQYGLVSLAQMKVVSSAAYLGGIELRRPPHHAASSPTTRTVGGEDGSPSTQYMTRRGVISISARSKNSGSATRCLRKATIAGSFRSQIGSSRSHPP